MTDPRTITSAEAHEIYSEFVSGMNLALLEGNGCYVCAHTIFPFVMRTETATLSVDCPDHARTLVAEHSRALAEHGVTEYFSLTSKAEFDGKAQITGHHTTHVLRGTERVVHPYPGSVCLKLVGGLWRHHTAYVGVHDTDWPIGLQDVRPPRNLPFPQ